MMIDKYIKRTTLFIESPDNKPTLQMYARVAFPHKKRVKLFMSGNAKLEDYSSFGNVLLKMYSSEVPLPWHTYDRGGIIKCL